jgi:UDP-glucose 4-epimerase
VKVLVTGASGFVGGHLAGGLGALAGRFQVLAPTHEELELLDSEAVRAYLTAEDVAAVVHCAVRPGHRNAADPSAQVYRNVRMFHNLARCADLYDRLVFVSSGAVYGAEHYRPRMAESFFDAHVPTDDHGFSKYVCGKYAESHPEIVELRLFGVFGPGEDYTIRFISNAICKALFDLPITIKQDRRFDYLYVDDLAGVVSRFLERRPAHGAYNVCGGRTYLLTELAALVLAQARKELPVVVTKPGLGAEYSGDNARLLSEMPDLRFTPMDAAIDALNAWYEARRDALDRDNLMVDR